MTVPLQRVDCLKLILDTPKGRGVFATRKIEAGTVVDTAPVIILHKEQFDNYIQHSLLLHYSYNWPIACETPGKYTIHQAVVLGLGSMFNHSSIRQNIGWKRNLEKEVIVYTALRDIAEGEELLISYGSHLTFEDVEAAQMKEGEEDVIDILARIDI
ncbi:SET domain-containing protein [Choiromyces venosus 120613-1]|uniref:SET domain-containing protein n=1 Tax=Choiromyces venosus 120613-1 TaxID=1336337 RepID=A0A3N4JNW7_9PEZI|nr:SET domain-containing protein [Choiromyces venosus 120613-1]